MSHDPIVWLAGWIVGQIRTCGGFASDVTARAIVLAEISDGGELIGRDLAPGFDFLESRVGRFAGRRGGGDGARGQSAPADDAEQGESDRAGALANRDDASTIDEGNREQSENRERRQNDGADDFERAFK